MEDRQIQAILKMLPAFGIKIPPEQVALVTTLMEISSRHEGDKVFEAYAMEQVDLFIKALEKYDSEHPA